MRKFIILTLLTFILLGNYAYAAMLGMKDLKIDFTNMNDAKTKAIWSEPDKINITENGLGWDGEQNSSRNIWIQTIPLAVGFSWRPAL